MKVAMKHTLAAISAALVAACGGGGGGSDGNSANNPLAKYSGVYYACDKNERTTVTLTAAGSDSLYLSFAEDVYAGDNCSGALLGSYRLLSPATITYKGPTTASLPPITLLPSSDRVDEVAVSAAGVTAQLTGSGVVGRCVKYSYATASGTNTGESCFDFTFPSAPISGAIYLTADSKYLVQFTRENGVLSADSIASKDASFNYNMLKLD